MREVGGVTASSASLVFMHALYHAKKAWSINACNILRVSTEKKTRGRPALPEEQRGIQIPYRVWPQTVEALREIGELTGEACGVILNQLIARELERIRRVCERRRLK